MSKTEKELLEEAEAIRLIRTADCFEFNEKRGRDGSTMVIVNNIPEDLFNCRKKQ